MKQIISISLASFICSIGNFIFAFMDKNNMVLPTMLVGFSGSLLFHLILP